MRFALTNRSSLIHDEKELAAMAAAGLTLANERFLPAWKRLSIDGAFYPDPNAVPAGACVFTLLDASEEEGTLGLHSEVEDAPYATILVKPVLDAGGGVLDGGRAGVSVASVFGHELFELLVDPFIDDWAQMPDGRFLAKETADPVESVGVPVRLPDGTLVLMSDGVLPGYFDPQAKMGPFDLAGEILAPFQLHKGGYQILFDVASGQPTQVFGASYPEWRKKTKERPLARTSRRLRRLEQRLRRR